MHCGCSPVEGFKTFADDVSHRFTCNTPVQLGLHVQVGQDVQEARREVQDVGQNVKEAIQDVKDLQLQTSEVGPRLASPLQSGSLLAIIRRYGMKF